MVPSRVIALVDDDALWIPTSSQKIKPSLHWQYYAEEGPISAAIVLAGQHNFAETSQRGKSLSVCDVAELVIIEPMTFCDSNFAQRPITSSSTLFYLFQVE